MNIQYKGQVMGMESFGCKHVKTDFDNMVIYFIIPTNFTDKMITRASRAFSELLGLTLKIKRET